MALKDHLLKYFSLHPDTYHSGAELAEKFQVSRAAVWKAVRALQSDGYEIFPAPAKGYCFTDRNDILNAEVISGICPEITAPVYVFDTIDSTNNYARILAAGSCLNGTVVIANHQTAGRGRQGHTFYSPKDTGLYFSLIFHPENMDYISRITPAAAVASVESLSELTGIHPQIKWVNDLYIGRKKIAGILSEAVTEFETGIISTVIIGIGININTSEFPDEIRGVAGSLTDRSISRNHLAALLRKNLLMRLSDLQNPSLMELYRRDSAVLGREITYTVNGETMTALAKDINDEGNLVLEKKDGSIQILQSGEISIKDWQIP